ncbi:MAG TPA: helix-turn-helix transcriptional regulator [Chthonomonadales bacterium]|nr:helix-turn-helix transcriptional regulator [Chthonomonadales bacterium]
MDLSTRSGRREQGLRIQQAVERAGLSVEELAGRIGCSRALIYQYLSGTTLAQPDRLQQIATECSVPLIFFYSDEDAPAPQAVRPPVSPAQPGRGRPAAAPSEIAGRLAASLSSLEELAAAQESPPDYRALASTCERILSLASQLGDQAAQSRAQRRLGNAWLAMADYPRAAECLQRAVNLAVENRDADGEMSARQGLGIALVSMGQAERAREQFAQTAASDQFRGKWRGTLSLGGIHEMHGEYQQAMERFDEAATVLEEAEAAGRATLQEVAVGLLYVNANRTNVYLDGGDFRGARPLAEKCLADAEALGNADQHLEARLNLAWCDLGAGAWVAAYRGLTTMLQLARFVGDQGRETMARSWLGILLAAAGDHDTAIAHGKDALATALSRGDRRAELYAQLALADAYTGTALRSSEARYHSSQALAVATAIRLERSEIECRIRLARSSAQAGELAELADAANRALQLSLKLGARHLESLARYWTAEALYRSQNATNPGTGRRSAAASTELNRATEEATAALRLAEEIGFTETLWRAHELLARLAQPAGQAAAEEHLRASVSLLESRRAALLEAGLLDTLLENEDCLAVYVRLLTLLRANNRVDEAEAFLENTGWPPLSSRLQEESTSAGGRR